MLSVLPLAAVVVIPLVVLAVGFLLVLIAAVISILFKPQLTALAEALPVGAKYVQKAIDSIIAYTYRQIMSYAQTAIDEVVKWLDHTEKMLRAVPSELVDFATATANRLWHVVHVETHDIVKAFVNPVRAIARGAEDMATDAWTNVQALDTLMLNSFKALGRELAREVYAPLERIQTVTIPNVRADIAAARAYAATLTNDVVLPRVGELELDLDRIKAKLREVPDYLRDALPWIATVSGAITAAQAVDAIRSAHRARHKIDRLCELDLDDFDELLDFTSVLLGAGAIVAAVEIAARNAEPVLELLEETLRS